MKLSLEDTLPWIETINEHYIHLLKYKTWTLNGGVLVAQELRLNRQFGGIQRQIARTIKNAEYKCECKKALSVLAELQNKGVSSDAIYAFSKILDLERMGRERNPLGPRE